MFHHVIVLSVGSPLILVRQVKCLLREKYGPEVTLPQDPCAGQSGGGTVGKLRLDRFMAVVAAGTRTAKLNDIAGDPHAQAFPQAIRDHSLRYGALHMLGPAPF